MIIAHRGGYKDSKTKENSLDAFKWQIKENYADLLELDVHLSKDSKIMVNHDAIHIERSWAKRDGGFAFSIRIRENRDPYIERCSEACVIKKDEEEDRFDRDQASKVQFFCPPVQLYPMENQLVQLIEEYEQKGFDVSCRRSSKII